MPDEELPGSKAGDSVSLHDDRRDDEYREMPQDLGNKHQLPERLIRRCPSSRNDSQAAPRTARKTPCQRLGLGTTRLHRHRNRGSSLHCIVLDGWQLAAQWRFYCPNGDGVAVGFRTGSLPEGIQIEKDEPSGFGFIRIEKVDYTPVSDELPIVDSVIAELIAQTDE